MAVHRTLSGKDGVMKALADISRKMGGGSVSIGFMEGATYADGTPVAAVAFWNEYGKPNQPARPFFRTMIADKSPQWGRRMAAIAKSTDFNGPQTLALMGENIAGQLQESIIATNAPPLSPVTLMLRKMVGNQRHLITGAMVGEAAQRVAAGEQGATGTHAKPLVWTGDMLRAVTYKVDA